ncbi:MAG: sulfotransferase [Pseudomonadota bacterium]
MDNRQRILAEHYLDLAIQLIDEHAPITRQSFGASDDPERALQDALDLCQVESLADAEPVRTVHHLSCTGGTLFSKSIASMANVLMLNEVDFTSPLPSSGKNKSSFAPTDMISLIRQGDEKADVDLILQIFINDVRVLRHEQWKVGRALVLRDHSHSHFLNGEDVSNAPTLRDALLAHFPLRSILTVRDPVDSYLAMVAHNWHQHFLPSGFDEYCRRYHVFLDAYAGAPVFRYEDFVNRPKDVMLSICEALELQFFDRFEEVFDSFKFSGDSGRSGGVIEARSRREVSTELQAAFEASERHPALRDRLGYQPFS